MPRRKPLALRVGYQHSPKVTNANLISDRNDESEDSDEAPSFKKSLVVDMEIPTNSTKESSDVTLHLYEDSKNVCDNRVDLKSEIDIDVKSECDEDSIDFEMPDCDVEIKLEDEKSIDVSCEDHADPGEKLLPHVDHELTSNREFQNLLKCDYCGIICINHEELKKHWNEVHENSKHICIICNKEFVFLYELNYHLCRGHCKNKVAKFNFNEHLQNNVVFKDSAIEKQYSCNECGIYFTYLETLDLHLQRTHFKKPDFKCDMCHDEFVFPGVLNSHLENVHSRIVQNRQQTDCTISEEKLIMCSMCSESFADRDMAIDHLRGHLKEEKFPCTVCKQEFTGREALRKHLLVHADEDFTNKRFHKIQMPSNKTSLVQYMCNVCDKKFRNLGNYMQHVGVHLPFMPFSCSICQDIFTDSLYLRLHMTKHHSNVSSILLAKKA